MCKSVTEDHRVRRNGRQMKWAVAVASLLITLAGGIEQAAGQTGGAGLEVDVVDMAADTQTISIPLHRSVLVRTSMAVSRTSIVNSETVDLQPISAKELLITGKSYGRTNIVLWSGEEEQHLLDVSVDLDVEGLNSAIRRIDPQSTAKASSVLGSIVLNGSVSSGERAQRMMEVAELFLSAGQSEDASNVVTNHLEVAGEKQVLLHCTVAEVNRSATKELGVNGFLAGDDFGDGFVVNQLGGINPANIGAAADVPVNTTIPFLTGSEGIPLDPSVPLSLGFPRIQMQLFIRALADNSLLRVLAEPDLVAISGETASFLAGGEFPIPVPQGLDKVTVEFRQFGVRLNFTPIVKGNQLIRMKVKPEVSELDFTNTVQIQGFVIPGLNTRTAETTVELGSGQTIAIAGLLNEEVRAFTSRMPGIGDLPVLGSLFRSTRFQRSLTELVILVTPEIVAPMGPHQLPKIPGQDISDPSDFELYALGYLESAPKNGRVASDADGESGAAVVPSQPEELSLHGPWGQADVN